MAVTIRDVARAAGVSPATVSRALSSPEIVNEVTRALVEQTARSMGYRPNRNARGLITGRSGTIGLVVPDLENPFFGSICKGAQARAREAGYTVFIADTSEDPAAEREVFRDLGRQVDGIILCSARGTDDDIAQLASESPTVLINRRVDDIPAITYDHRSGVRAVMAHLTALGHRRIAYAGGPTRSWSNSKRHAAIVESGRELSGVEVLDLGNFPPYFSGGTEAGDLAIASGATAVVAFNDVMALGIMDRLGHRGLSVPGEMSVTGFDNVAVSTLVRPNLTTIDFPRIQMGRAAVDSLLGTVLGTPSGIPPFHEMPVQLVVRQSTGVPRDRGLDAPRTGSTASVAGEELLDADV